MKIIDFERKGNIVRFYVGADNCYDYWGDDWGDIPYEYNAGKVYDEYVLGYFDKVFDFDDIVCEPCVGCWSKEDMKYKKVPCIAVLPKIYKEFDSYCMLTFDEVSNNYNSVRYYFGDKVEDENIHWITDLA